MLELLREYDKNENKDVKQKLLTEINVEYPENQKLIEALFVGKFKINIIKDIEEIIEYLKSENYPQIKKLETIYKKTFSNHINIDIDEFNVELNNVKDIFDKEELKYREEIIRSNVYKISHKLYQLSNLLNSQIIIVNGDGATGKTHLLNKLNSDLLKEGVPSLILYGQNISDLNKKLEIISEKYTPKKDIINELNQYSTSNDTNGVVILDAINEVQVDSEKALDDFLKFSKHQNLKFIISYRNGYISPSTIKKLNKYPKIQLFGFTDIVEAAIKFGELYEIEINDILETGFIRNPLMLRYFCEAYNKKKVNNNTKEKAKHERGGKGAQFYFENAFKNICSKISKELSIKNIAGNRLEGKNLWNSIGKGMAKKMIANTRTYLTNSEMISFIDSLGYNVATTELIEKLKINKLIEKNYYWDSDKEGRGYKLSFQKQSDHLLARELLRKRKDLTWDDFFKEKWLLDFLNNNRSIVEALVESIPVYAKKELFEFINDSEVTLFSLSYIRGLSYRSRLSFERVSNVQNKILNYILPLMEVDVNVKAGWRSVLYSCSLLSYHPFNFKNYLNKRLKSLSNDSRDVWLKNFYFRLFSDEKIIAQLRMPSYAKINNFPKEFKDNYVSFAFWLLAMSNREFRDKATDSLTLLFRKDMSSINFIYSLMENITDEYIIERAFAIVYASNVLTKDKRHMKKAYKKMKVFIYNRKLSNIRVRHYFVLMNRMVKENNFCLFRRLNHKKLPKVKLNFINMAHEELKEEMKLGLDHSLVHMSLGYGVSDFLNYIVNSGVRRFKYENKKMRIDARKQKRKFIKSLSKEKQDAYKNYLKNRKKSQRNEKKKINEEYYRNLSLEELMEIKINTPDHLEGFKKILSKEDIKIFDDIGKEISRTSNDFIPNEILSATLFEEMKNAGYNKLIEENDQYIRSVSNRADRHNHQIERIGKKYQWIAYFRLLGQCISNLKLKDNINYRPSIDMDPIQVLNNPDIIYKFYDKFENKINSIAIDWDAADFVKNYDNLDILKKLEVISFEGCEFIPIHISCIKKLTQEQKEFFFRLNLHIDRRNDQINSRDLKHLTDGMTSYLYEYCIEELLVGQDEADSEKEYGDSGRFSSLWKECMIESEYNYSKYNKGENDNHHYYLLKAKAHKLLSLKYKYDGTYVDRLGKLAVLQSPYNKDYTYLYLRKDLFEKLNKKLSIIGGVYSEKVYQVGDWMTGTYDRGSEYDSAYKYINGKFQRVGLEKRPYVERNR